MKKKKGLFLSSYSDTRELALKKIKVWTKMILKNERKNQSAHRFASRITF